MKHASNITLRYCSFDLSDSSPIDIHRNGCIIIFSRDICPKSKVVPVCCWSKTPNNIQSHRVEIQSTAFGCESGANEKIHFENPSTKSHPTYPGYASNQQNIFELQIMIQDFTYHKLASLYIIGVDWGNFTNQLINFQTFGPFSNCHCRQSGRCCGSRSPRQNLFTWAKVGRFKSLPSWLWCLLLIIKKGWSIEPTDEKCWLDFQGEGSNWISWIFGDSIGISFWSLE